MGLLDGLFNKDENYDDDYDNEYYDEEADANYEEEYYEEERPKDPLKKMDGVYNVDQMNVTVILSAPTSTDDCSVIIENLKKNNVISLNLEKADDAMSQRIIDVLSGATFAVHATLQKISLDNDNAYLITPGPIKVDDSLMNNIDKDSRDILSKVTFGNK